jgi:hypothetical protein
MAGARGDLENDDPANNVVNLLGHLQKFLSMRFERLVQDMSSRSESYLGIKQGLPGYYSG